MDFKLVSDYVPTGDQPEAIDRIAQSIEEGNKYQTLVGVTGSGKTFAMANIIQRVKKPTLVLAHNKTLAAQLYSEFKEFFPENAVEYFVSYYDYYQPEAYVAHSDTYIEKDASINDEIDKLRHSATAAILERNDTIIISSVSCIYGLGDPKDYKELMLSLRPGMVRDRDDIIKRLVEIQYERNDVNFIRGTFRVRGDILEIFPASNDEKAIRIEFFGDEIDRITEIDYLTGKVAGQRNHVVIFPASHYVTTPERIERAIGSIEEELDQAIKVKYMHSDIVTLERTEIIRDLRLGKFDVLVGINLLREGLDIPEVSLVAILDADKEGFLRSETSMIQTIGRAARNANGRVIMYADRVTDSMQRAISETERRRSIQMAYNEKHGIVPKTIQKGVRDSIEATKIAEEVESYDVNDVRNLKDEAEISQAIIVLKSEMMAAAENLEFEKAAELRDKIMILEKKL